MTGDYERLPRPILAFIHSKDLTEERAWAIRDPFSDFRRGLVIENGRPNLDLARREMREALASTWQPLGFVESVEAPPVINPSHKAPHRFVQLCHQPPLGYDGDPQYDSDPQLQQHLEFPLFRQPRFRYFTAQLNHTGTPLDLNHPANSMWYRDRMQIVADLLEAEYAFCVNGPFEFSRPEIHDPRAFPWDLTYFGPALVKEIGEQALQEAPARQVWSDHRGGCWVQLGEMPFVPVVDDGASRQALMDHLGLQRRFPQSSDQDGA